MRAKKRFRKQMLALLLSAVMIADPAASAAVTYAAEPVIGQTVDSVEDVSEMEDQDTVETEVGEDETDSGKTDGEEGGSEEIGGDENGSDETGDEESGSDETGSDETGSDENDGEDQETDQDGEDADSEEELPADETDEEEDADEQDTVSDNDLEEEEDKDNWQGTGHKAPELEMQLTSAMVSEKRELKGTVDRLQALEKNVHYMANEAIFLADSQKYAETVAQGYGATLESCEEGVAVMTFPDEVTDIIAMAEDEKVKLPAVYPNYYYTAFEDIVVYSDAVPIEDDNVAMAVNNIDPNLQYYHDEIHSTEAWNYNDTAGSGIKVAVIDSGIEKNHEDLKGRVASAGVTYSTPYNKAEDNNGHGTHVSGIIAATKNNGKGGAGIAYKSTIVSYKALEHNPITWGASGSTADIIKAVNASVKSGARVINMSLGGYVYDSLYEATINAAVNKGVVVVAAAGNETTELSKDKTSKNYCSPACFDNVITVSAKVKGSAAKADFSNYGSDIIDITAPGTEIYSSVPGGYYTMKGTSQATPMVAAAAAYILSVSPDLKNNKTKSTVDTVKRILQDSATKTGYSNKTYFGEGLLNVEAAVKMAAPSSKNGGTGELTAPEVKIGADVVANNATIQDTDTITLSATVGGAANPEVKIYYTTDGKAPSEKSTEYKNTGFTIPASGAKTIKAVAVYYGKKSKVTSVKVKVNAKMTSFAIASKTDSLVLGAGKSMALITKDITPAYATNKKVTWQIVNPGTAGENVSITAGGQLKATAKITAKTDITVQATASDGSNVKSNILTITLLPKVNKLTLAAPTLEGKGPYQLDYDNNNKTVQMTVAVEPAEANTGISYTTSNKNVADVSPAGLVTAVGNGKATITAKTTDGSNKKVTLQVQVTKKVQSVTVSSKTGQYQIAAGKTLDMVATVTSDATNKKVKWSITGEAATINEKTGKLTAKASNQVSGVSTVKVKAEATDESGKFGETTITVYPIITGSITFENGTSCTLGTTKIGKFEKSIQLKPYTNTGDSADFFGRAEGSSSGLDNFTYTSSNAKIATVSPSGLVNVAEKTGTAKIKVTAKDGSGKSASFTVKVVNPVTSISIYSKTGGNIVGRNKTLALGALVNSNASNKKLTWTSSDKSIATVDKNGKVKGISKTAATVTITATANDESGVELSVPIKVRPAVTKIAFQAENSVTHVVSYATNVVTKWYVGDADWPTPAVFDEASPYTPINKQVTAQEFWSIVGYSCSNSNVIQLVPDEDGILYFVAVNPGKATITYKALDGSGKVCKLNVTVVK